MERKEKEEGKARNSAGGGAGAALVLGGRPWRSRPFRRPFRPSPRQSACGLRGGAVLSSWARDRPSCEPRMHFPEAEQMSQVWPAATWPPWRVLRSAWEPGTRGAVRGEGLGETRLWAVCARVCVCMSVCMCVPAEVNTGWLCGKRTLPTLDVCPLASDSAEAIQSPRSGRLVLLPFSSDQQGCRGQRAACQALGHGFSEHSRLRQ